MLQQFSWGHFLIAMIVLNLVWYVFVGLVFYRAEVLAFLARGEDGLLKIGVGPVNGEARPSGMEADDNVKAIEREVDTALMGSSRLPEGVEVRSSSQVSFSASDTEDRYDQVGLIADVLHELKSVFAELENRAGDKRDFFRLLGKLKEEYGPLSGHPSVAALTGFIVERASFHLTADEIDNLWF
jgi:hypothetical protein